MLATLQRLEEEAERHTEAAQVSNDPTSSKKRRARDSRKLLARVKAALDEKTIGVSISKGEKRVDTAEVPTLGREEEGAQPIDALTTSFETDGVVGEATVPTGPAVLASEVPTMPVEVPAPPESQKAPGRALDSYREALRDLFSERIVQMRKVDVTATAFQGAAGGFAVMGLLFVLLRPK